MSSQSENNALALHEILLSISDSLNEAQINLRNMPPYDQYGRPNTLYQLPYLDFHLEVISEFDASSVVTETSGGDPMSPKMPANGKLAKYAPANYLKFTPFKNTETSTAVSNRIVSNISGRFVAILPNEGLPQVYLGIRSKYLSGGTFEITVSLVQATSEPVIGQKIELNFDEATTLAMNGTALSAAPVFVAKEGYTNPTGEFTTNVTMNAGDYSSGKTVILVANSGTIFSSTAISNL